MKDTKEDLFQPGTKRLEIEIENEDEIDVQEIEWVPRSTKHRQDIWNMVIAGGVLLILGRLLNLF